MKTIEYKVVYIGGYDLDDIRAELDKLGAEAWELVSVIPHNFGYRYYFKRVIINPYG